jgi:hypothetical protein
MTRNNLTLKRILTLLNNKGLLTQTEIIDILNLHRSTIFRNLQIAKKSKWIEEVEPGKYNITTLGKRHTESANVPSESFNIEVYTQVLGFLPIHSDKPKVNCVIEIEKAEKIKEKDRATNAELRFLTNDGLWLPENDTNLKASVACVVDSLLDSVAKNKGLFTMLDEEFRKETTICNFKDKQPGYDYRKRLMDLARTNFQILIKYNGEEWVKQQNFENMEKYLENSHQIYNKSLNDKAKWKKRQKINQVIKVIDEANYKAREHRLKENGLFKTEEDAKSFIYDNLKLVKYQNENEVKQIIDESFNSGLLKTEERKFHCLEINKEKLPEFFRSISSILDEKLIF